MEDFNSYSSHTDSKVDNDILNMVNSIAGKFEGKSSNDLLSAIYKEAERGKRNGTLSNEQIDAFVQTLWPALDDKKRKYLKKVAEQIKKL